ncbi:alpha-amylase [bacterium (Candidatus Blackallbacteria) CG17_big_fil_post_rev_8_21_14_2_50_48_46]|uniref:Alpha-amylase n=1 Tax=bacterium (Candidatus Blackallbacteria) CG17_big_fil_post_rev_8_21_14_2_50_48_46 TaxID=2014261 RepID=A0A2M7GBN0_9BACT|nr:MAG: alpha-amylase [bacterium (Candidatus Blackallbacteria) CG18_big_fil_WC_8_21_14_2_50_49_26]PIW19576.1 MAG: alpha-amylase [bacterium (Candidatus Blackallbacteria) CG17_big_fil_post_rev_8_21_14_2_50_48_46]PIW49102.1 MAG: alpha-amylase [bacterium (Candidatus Blackallbacteria) CG13_big_fil_rev_8_21_14_2_50_49_14]
MYPHWSHNAFFYHIYPLGMCGAPHHNSDHSAPVPRLELLHAWIPHLVSLGVNAICLGPVFESTSHGYDTRDYYHLDRRLGTHETLAHLVKAFHRAGIRVILDAVFNHTGREFWAFQDLRRNGQNSAYLRWYRHVRFGKRSKKGDPFTYQGWKGHHDLAKLNVRNPAVREHLFGALAQWVDRYEIDGLRLDAADCLDFSFMKRLRKFSHQLSSDFWLMGEVVMGNYRDWVNPQMLDSVTNFEFYHSLHTSHNAKDYHILAHTLERQFGQQGVYRHLPLLNFVDNHDVNRIASLLKEERNLYPLHILLMTLPGVPTLYYGSEWGLEGKRHKWSDKALRPYLPSPELGWQSKHKDLALSLQKLAKIYHQSDALKHGQYQTLQVHAKELAFLRQSPSEHILVAVNASGKNSKLEIPLHHGKGIWEDLLNPGEYFEAKHGRLKISPLYPYWGRILRHRLT